MWHVFEPIKLPMVRLHLARLVPIYHLVLARKQVMCHREDRPRRSRSWSWSWPWLRSWTRRGAHLRWTFLVAVHQFFSKLFHWINHFPRCHWINGFPRRQSANSVHYSLTSRTWCSAHHFCVKSHKNADCLLHHSE